MRIYPDDISQFLTQEKGEPSSVKLRVPEKIDTKDTQVLVSFGLSGLLCEKMQLWLRQDPSHMLILVESQKSSISEFLSEEKNRKYLENRRIHLYWLQEEHLEELCNEIAWECVFLTLKIIEVKPSTISQKFIKELEFRHLGVFLLASDTVDFGVSVMENVYANFQSRSSLLKAGATESCFQIPAIICGAGPSLEKNAEALRGMENQALFFAGGAALNTLDKQNIRPHFAAAIDKGADPRIFQQHHCWEVPFFFQARMQKKNFSLVHGPEILVSDSGGYLLERWLHEELNLGNSPENIGWNVATFLTKIAVDLGCNPIIFVGMDLAYDKAPYSEGGPKSKEASVRIENFQGKKVWTQKDWIISAYWIRDFIKSHTNTQFYAVSDIGLDLSPAENVPIQEIQRLFLGKSYDTLGYAHHAISMLSVEHLQGGLNSKLRDIRESLKRTQKKLDEILEQIEISYAANELKVPEDYGLVGELVYGKLLWPLWQIWQHIIKRGVDDRSEIDPEVQMQIHRLVFFKQVIEKHLEVTRG